MFSWPLARPCHPKRADLLGGREEVGDGEAMLGSSAGVLGTEEERRTPNSRIRSSSVTTEKK